MGVGGAILKVIGSYAALIFVIWSMYFGNSYDFSIWTGLLAFVALLLIVGFLQAIPFGTTFLPILFEWYWHDVPFWDFSAVAWVITGISLSANLILFATAYFGQEPRPV